MNIKLQNILKFLFYIWIAVLPTQLAYHYWPESVLLKGLRVDYLAVTIYASELVLLGFVGLSVICQIIKSTGLQPAPFEKGEKLPPFSKGIGAKLPWGFTCCLLLTIYLLIQAFWVPFAVIHLIFIAKLVLYGLAVFFISRLPYSRKVVSLIFSVQIIVLLILAGLQLYNQHALQGIWYWFGERNFHVGTPGIAIEDILGQEWLRPYATFSHPNVLAGYALVVGLWIADFIRNRIKCAKVKTQKSKLQLKSKKRQNKSRSLSNWLVNRENLILFIGVAFAILIDFLSFSQATWFVGVVAMVLILFQWIPDNGARSLSRTSIRGCHFRDDKWKWILGVLIFIMLIPFVMLLLPQQWVGESLELRNQLFLNYLNSDWVTLLFGSGWHGFLQTVMGQDMFVVTPKLLQPIHHSWWYVVSVFGWLWWLLVGLLIIVTIKAKKVNTKRICVPITVLCILLLGSVDHYWVTQVQTIGLLVFVVGDTIRTLKG